jgi:hypothetical protein
MTTNLQHCVGTLPDKERDTLVQALLDYRDGVIDSCDDPDELATHIERIESLEAKLGI